MVDSKSFKRQPFTPEIKLRLLGSEIAQNNSLSGRVSIFREQSGSQSKLFWSTGDGLCLLTKRLSIDLWWQSVL